MSEPSDVATGLRAALRLARGDASGAALLAAPQPDIAWRIGARSFWAIGLALPWYIGLDLIDWAAAGAPAHPAIALIAELISFVTGWVGFSLLSHGLAARHGRAAEWPRYIAAWNWTNLIGNVVQAVTIIPVLIGLPDWVIETVWLAATGWTLWLEWFATRTTLRVPAATAALFTLLDFMVSLFLIGFSDQFM